MPKIGKTVHGKLIIKYHQSSNMLIIGNLNPPAELLLVDIYDLDDDNDLEMLRHLHATISGALNINEVLRNVNLHSNLANNGFNTDMKTLMSGTSPAIGEMDSFLNSLFDDDNDMEESA